MVRVGVIGGGKIAERHIHAYKRIEGVEIFVTDVNGNITQDLCKNFGANFSIAPEVILGDNTIDVIDVCTPTSFHKDLILEAIKYRKHIFCEKPLCQSLEEALEIKKAIEDFDKVMMVGYLYRFHPAFQFVKQVLEEGIIGHPYFAIFRLGGRGSHKEWKHKKKEGGGAIHEMLVHKIDLALWFFGQIKGVKTLRNKTILPLREISGKKVHVDAEDYVVVEFEAKNGTKILCESDLISPSYMEYIEIHGDNGSIFTSILNYFPTVVYCKERRNIYNEGNNFRNFPAVNLFEEELSYFIKKVREGVKDTISIEDSIQIMEIIDKIRK